MPGWRFAFAAVGAAVFGMLAAFLVTNLKPEAIGARSEGASQAGSQNTGTLSMSLPKGASAAGLRFTLLRLGEVVVSPEGKPLRDLPPDRLGVQRLDPGIYIVRIAYHGRRLPDAVAQVQPGVATLLQVSSLELAELEYRAGVASDLRGITGVEYFRRAIRLDPGHVNAHLQLAAYELLHGAPQRVKEHLAVVRRVAPRHPDVIRVERLLQQREKKMR